MVIGSPKIGMRANEAKTNLGESLPATAPSVHSGFSKGSLGLSVLIVIIGTSVCDKNHLRSEVMIYIYIYILCVIKIFMGVGKGWWMGRG